MGTYIGQIEGPFIKNKDISFPNGIGTIFKLGITCVPGHIVSINGEDIEIGITGLLELEGLRITSIKFRQDEDLNTFIDYMASPSGI